METDNLKEISEFVLAKAENYQKRYIEAETFLLEVLEMPWYKRFFLDAKILEFFKTRNKFDS